MDQVDTGLLPNLRRLPVLSRQRQMPVSRLCGVICLGGGPPSVLTRVYTRASSLRGWVARAHGVVITLF